MRKFSWRTLLLAGFASLGSMNAATAIAAFPFTEAWYAERANDPPGARQVESHGKLWPPYPRAVGRKQTKLHSYHYSHYWPYPHNCEDEAFTQNIINLQAANGWSSATTLHDYHFNAETQQLTDDGRAHLLWVSHSVPPQFRTIYVSQGLSPEIAQLRVATAEQFLRESGIPNPPRGCNARRSVRWPTGGRSGSNSPIGTDEHSETAAVLYRICDGRRRHGRRYGRRHGWSSR